MEGYTRIDVWNLVFAVTSQDKVIQYFPRFSLIVKEYSIITPSIC